MRFENKRIFISDLPEASNQSEIESLFGAYGKVVSINIKQRKELGPKNKSLSFAYITLETDDRALQRCFKDFAQNDWHGEYVNLQLAKENFLDRLKREREEAAQEKANHDQASNQKSTQCNTSNGDTKEVKERKISSSNGLDNCDNSQGSSSHKNVNSIIKNKKYLGAVVNNEVDLQEVSIQDAGSLEVEEKKYKKKKCSVDNNYAGDVSCVQETECKDLKNYMSGMKIINNRHKLHDKEIKIESAGNKPVAIIDLNKKKRNNTGTEKSSSELKRIQAIKDKLKSYSERKQVIKAALSNVDVKQNKKIIFDDDYTNSITTLGSATKPKDTPRLFESDDEEQEDDIYEPDFTIKEQYEGAKGKMLLEMQSRFKNDKRFTMSKEFLDDEVANGDENMLGSINGRNETVTDETLQKEKEKELEILSGILGPKITGNTASNKNQNYLKRIIRYDPNDQSCASLELKKEEPVGKKKKKEIKINEEMKQEEKELPTVSKEVFYQVSDKLKETFQESNEGFSLLSMFGRPEHKDEEMQQEPELPTELPKFKNKLFPDKNPFKYDSSDDEDQTGNIPSNEDLNNQTEEQKESRRNISNNRSGDSFFFKKDDYRFQDGIDFIKRIASKEETDFIKVRQELKSIVRSKVRHNQRKNKPFKKKLGGNAKKKKKQLRMKKALQR